MWFRDPRFWSLFSLFVIVSCAIVLILRPVAHAGPAGAKRNADGTYGKDHFDPIKKNGEIFKDWPKPKAVLLFSSEQDGYIEPCGCAGLENQKGGMSRRHDLIKQLQAKQWPVAALDGGGLVKGFGKQAIEKYTAAVDCLKAMNYSAIGLAIEELKLPGDEILAITFGDERFVSANVGLNKEFSDDNVRRYRTFTMNGLKFGVTSILGTAEAKLLNNRDLIVLDPVKALTEIMPKLVAEKCDRVILFANSDSKEAELLGKQFPQFTDVVCGGVGDVPPQEPRVIPGTKTNLLETGHKGMYVVALGIFDDPKEPLRYQSVPLDARFGDSDEIGKIFANYQKKLETSGLNGLGVKAAPHPSGRGAFAGSTVCGDCHTKAYDIWKNGPHFDATETLVNGTPPRLHDPECISCHVTGWEPQKYFPFNTGYLDYNKDKDLHGNGCENCHGPGKKHVQAENGDLPTTPQQLAALRNSMKVAKDQAGCVQCHDVDNSPEFDFKKYWPQIEHKGKD